MYALFEEAGRFLAGRVMAEAAGSVQVELDSGKRVKVKAANVLIRFEQPAPAELIEAGQRIAAEIDLDLAWEFAPEGDFGFADLARDYFDASAGADRQAAALFRLFEAPHYFRRVGKGQFRKAPEETVKAALLGIERKRQQALRIQEWADELVGGRCPEPVANHRVGNGGQGRTDSRSESGQRSCPKGEDRHTPIRVNRTIDTRIFSSSESRVRCE